MFDIFQNVSTPVQLEITVVLYRLSLCLILTSFAAIAYTKIYNKTHSLREVTPHILLALCISTVLMSIGDSIPHSFGLFAALTLIRFRTPIKSSQDLVSLFFFIVIGISCGLGHFKISLVSTLFITAAIYLMNRIKLIHLKDHILQINYSGSSAEDVQKGINLQIEKYASSYSLIEVRSLNDTDLEFIYEIQLSDESSITAALQAIQGIDGIKNTFIQTIRVGTEAFD